MPAKRDALAEDLSTLASDFRSLLETLTHDQKEQARKERRWRALYTVTGVVFTLGARRLATKTWSILTGELPPAKQQQPAPAGSERAASERPESERAAV